MSGWRLITGTTGFLGRYLLFDCLRRREKVAVLVRNRRGFSAADRIDQIISEWEVRTGVIVPRPVVLAGDLLVDGLDLSDVDRVWFQSNVSSVIHSAASVCFQETSRGEPVNSNVHGTHRLLELCQHSHVREFHYVSTAYSCGRVDRSRPVLEEMHSEAGPFGNIYEESKCRAEHLVQTAAGAFTRTLFRPSIVIGESTSGYTSSYNTIYSPLRLAWMIYKESIQAPPTRDDLLDGLGLDGDEARNIVPVDWVCEMIGALVRDPACHGRIYHLTNPRLTPGRKILSAISRALSNRIDRSNAASPSSTKGSTGLAEFQAHMESYRSYFASDPIFDSSTLREQRVAVECPVVDEDMLTRTFRYAVDHQFKVNAGEILPPEQTEFRRQLELRIHDAISPRLDKKSLRIGNMDSSDAEDLAEIDVVDSPSALASILQITLTGPGGGIWQVSASKGGLNVAYPSNELGEAVHFYSTAASFRAWLKSGADIEEEMRTGAFVFFGGLRDFSEVTKLMNRVRSEILAAETCEVKSSGANVASPALPPNNLSVGTLHVN